MPLDRPSRPRRRVGATAAVAAVALTVLGACGTLTPESPAPGAGISPAEPAESVGPADQVEPAAPTAEGPQRVVAEDPAPYVVADGRARDATLSIPAVGIAGLRVQTYRGRTDDATGHAIQNTGIAASPSGPDGGTGAGGVGNYQVTGHRNSAGGVFGAVPELSRGDRVLVRADGVEYVYRVTATRITSFRSERSLREQRAPVPGRPGVEATRAMITLSTCRTQEDHAEGNYWADEFDNPEHRIDKIGVLVGSSDL